MKKKASIIAIALVFFLTTAFVIVQQNQMTEAARHPRIENAIRELESAVEYMEKAPDNFGGYKAQAIADSKQAIRSLKKALEYRSKVDNGRKR